MADSTIQEVRNVTMRALLAREQCLDVRKVGVETDSLGVFELREFVPDIEYCDGLKEHWIDSIGRRKSDGRIFASVKPDMYDNPNFECLFLR